jgi:hypothetical protein
MEKLMMNNPPQELNLNLTKSSHQRKGSVNDSQYTVHQPQRISAQELHKYVLSLIGIFMLFLVTCPIAMNRVAQTKKFAPDRSHLKSLTLEYQSIELPSLD